MPEFVKAGALEPLDSYISGWKNNDVIANLWDLQRIKAGDPLYMVPWEAVYLYLYYRPDLFKEANLAVPDSIDSFLAAAKALTKGGRYGYGMRGASGGDQAWAMLTYPNGLRFADQAGNIVLDNDAAVQANQWYLDLFLKEKVCPPSAPADGFAQITGAIQSGATAMTIHHVGSSAAMVKALGDNITAIPVPAGPQGRFAVAAVVYNVVFKSSKNKDAAFTFASYLAEKDPNDKWAEGAHVLPIVQSLQSKYASKDRFYKASIDSVPFAGVYPMVPALGNWTSNVWPATMQQALNGKIDSKTMCKTLADALKA
jgi:multiple sugar transport system substrate-binding protein